MPALMLSARPRKASAKPRGKSARRSAAPPAAIVDPARLERLNAYTIDFIPHATFDQPRVAAEILAECQQPLRADCLPEDAPRPRAGLPAYLASLYDHTLLSADEERRLFRQMNFLKHRAWRLRGRLPGQPRTAQIEEIERLLRRAEDVRNELIRSNLRLVVSIARPLLDAEQSFDNLVSEGNIALMRAVEKFDFARGFRFSTYATWAVRRAMLHLKAADRRRARRSVGDEPLADAVAPAPGEDQPTPAEAQESLHLLARILPQLNDREQSVIDLRFGLHDRRRTLRQLGAELGVSKERIRQIELRALSKLRAMVLGDAADPATPPTE